MLKWLKKLTDRFFNEEIEEANQEEEIQEEQAEVNKQNYQNERPAFRFPIITDAEIYGWEDDDIGEVKQSEKDSTDRMPENDFDPVPLYENERWPGTPQKVNRHEGNSLFKSETERILTEKKRNVLKKEENLQSERYAQVKSDLNTIQSNRRTQRFTPSQVPSPIYGYTKPKESIHRNIELERSEEIPASSNDLENTRAENEVFNAAQGSEEEKSEASLTEQQEVIEKETNISETIDDLLEDSSDFTEESEDESQTLIEEPSVLDCSNESQLKDDTEEIVTHEETVVFEDTKDEEMPEQAEDFLMPKEQEEDTPEEVDVNNSQLTIDEPAEEKLTEEREETNDEKIVPFNVLMLKSDKRKLKARQLANEIADEMKAKKKAAPVQEEQSLVEEVEQEVSLVEKTKVNEEKEDNKKLEEEQPLEHYAFPKLNYLVPPENKIEDTEWLTAQSEKLEESLSHFGVQANVVDAVQGPTVTRFEFTVGQGTKVSRVRNLTDDLKLALAARDIRIEAPIPGKSSIGIEIPNRQARAVRISEVIQTESFQRSESPLEAVLGLGLTGEPVTLDLREMPHGMIAGATGSGKSVCINSILVSLLYKASPTELQMMLIDPKMVELAPFNGIPHLISPVITDVKAATAALKWAVAEMERRYELLAHAGVRDVERYNQQVVENRQFSLKMPYLLIVIDELADLMMMAPADVEVSISRIAQKARACGIHLIIATQRPSVDVITGIIKANIPTRIAFSVSSQVDSRTMIDTNGAERLLGKGDMLYLGNGESMPIRLQGTFVTDDEIERIIEHVQREASPTYLFGQDELLKSATEEEEDPLFTAVCEFIYNQNSASTSMLQRNFSIGYNRAAKLMDRLEELSFISPQQGSKARDVYLTEADLSKLKETIL